MNEENLEKAAAKAIYESISKCLSNDFNGPVRTCVNSVFEKRRENLESIALSALDSILDSKEFPEAIKKAINDKLARNLVSGLGGELEKRVNELKADPVTRAKITIALNEILTN